MTTTPTRGALEPEAAERRRSLRLLIVTPRYLPETGGVEEHVSQVARRAAASGLDVTVLTTVRDGRQTGREWSDGVEVIRVRARPRRRDFRFAPEILGVIEVGRWDLVHVQSYHTFVAPLAMIGALRARLPFVLTFHAGGHSSRLRHRLRPLQRRLLGPLLRRAARLIVLTQTELDTYARELRLSHDRFDLIPNGVDPSPPPAVDPDLPQYPRPLIASVGRLERYKGHHRVIEAMPWILASRPTAYLWIAGSGGFESKLRKIAEKLDIVDRVEIRSVPADDRGGMAARLAQADVVVLMSSFETQPIAALEAAALGRPLVVADTPGLSELADAGAARRVAGDADARTIAAAVLHELDNPRSSPQMTLPTWDDCAASLARLYASVAEEQCASST